MRLCAWLVSQDTDPDENDTTNSGRRERRPGRDMPRARVGVMKLAGRALNEPDADAARRAIATGNVEQECRFATTRNWAWR